MTGVFITLLAAVSVALIWEILGLKRRLLKVEADLERADDRFDLHAAAIVKLIPIQAAQEAPTKDTQ